MTSACEILDQEPERFLDYILADANLRKQIVDDKSFEEVLRRVLESDPTLKNIVNVIDGVGESLEVCGRNILLDNNIQELIRRNTVNRRARIRRKVKKQHPSYTRGQLTKEINKRLKISISGAKHKVKQTKQVTISKSLQPVRVGSYDRKGKVIGAYRKTTHRKLTRAEKMLIKNNIKLPPSEVVKKYYDSGLTFRSETSIKRHYYRMKRKLV